MGVKKLLKPEREAFFASDEKRCEGPKSAPTSSSGEQNEVSAGLLLTLLLGAIFGGLQFGSSARLPVPWGKNGHFGACRG